MTSIPVASAAGSSTDAVWLQRRNVALPRPAAVAACLLATVSGLALWGFAYGRLLGRIQEGRSQHELHSTLREQLARQTSPIGGHIRVGAPVAFLRVPSIGIGDEVVVEGTSSGVLTAGPGHRRDTALPGQPGVSVLMGRSVAFGAPFASVAHLHRGAIIDAVTGQGTFRYRVERVRRDGDDLPTPLPVGGARLTLVTSEGSDNLTGGWERHTVFVDALLAGPAQPRTGAAPVRRLPSVEAAMRGDPRAAVPLALWLAALVVTLAAAAWAYGRWGSRPTLLASVPVVVACLWGATEVAARLVPNLV
ncbi:MAG: class E sortase [Actinobacteria bacterium]|nr:class E sortase [Actinomycetota bacterium]MBV9254714.1 class E sortase [Actinomycetota bacterium]